MKFSIAATTPFLPLLLIVHFSGSVEGKPALETNSEASSGGFVMQSKALPIKVYREITGALAYTIKEEAKGPGFDIYDGRGQSVFHVASDKIICTTPFSLGYPSEDLNFVTTTSASSPPEWTIQIGINFFDYRPKRESKDDFIITRRARSGQVDTALTTSHSNKGQPWMARVFQPNSELIHIKPSMESSLPVKYVLALWTLQKQREAKCIKKTRDGAED